MCPQTRLPISSPRSPSSPPQARAGTLHPSFYPFEASDNSNGGASASVGDIDGDGLKDLIIGAAPGTSPYVSIFDTGTLALKKRFLAYDAAFLGGINVSAGV